MLEFQWTPVNVKPTDTITGMSLHAHAPVVLEIMIINIANYQVDGMPTRIKYTFQNQKYKNKNTILSRCQSLTEKTIDKIGKNQLFSIMKIKITLARLLILTMILISITQETLMTSSETVLETIKMITLMFGMQLIELLPLHLMIEAGLYLITAELSAVMLLIATMLFKQLEMSEDMTKDTIKGMIQEILQMIDMTEILSQEMNKSKIFFKEQTQEELDKLFNKLLIVQQVVKPNQISLKNCKEEFKIEFQFSELMLRRIDNLL